LLFENKRKFVSGIKNKLSVIIKKKQFLKKTMARVLNEHFGSLNKKNQKIIKKNKK